MKIIPITAVVILSLFFYYDNAYAQSSNPNLFVSAENSLYQNHFAGSMVVEVVVNDPNLLDTDEGKGEPDVTLNGKKLRMVQATDGKWYAYFANLDGAKQADQTVGSDGEGLDFGVFCSSSTATSVLGASFSDTDGIAIARETTGDFTNGLPSLKPCTGTIVSGNQINNVVRLPRFVNTNPNIPSGQIGLNVDAWPVVQLFSFDDVVIRYNRAGGTQTVKLFYDEIPNISINLDRENYPTNSEVFITINDIQLNQDPTSVDSWTFNVGSPVATFYQAFSESGANAANGGPGLVNLVPQLSNLGFEKNGKFTMKLNNVAVLKTNTDQPASSATDGPNTFTSIVTFVESTPNSGIFENFDSGNKANVGISPSAPRGNTAILDYNANSKSILTGSSTASLTFDFKSVTLKAGQKTPITLIDNDQNLNPSSRDDLDVFRSTAIVPTLQIGDPVTLEKASNVVFYPDSASPLTIPPGIAVTSSIPDKRSDRLILDTRSPTPNTGFEKISLNLGITASVLKALLIDSSPPNTDGTNWINYDFRSLQNQLDVSSFSDTRLELHFGSLGSSIVVIADQGDLPGSQGLIQIDDSDVDDIVAKSGQVFLVINFDASASGGPPVGSISSETDTQPVVFDLFSFGIKNNKEVNNAIYRFELRETNANSGMFSGSLEYAVTSQLNIFDPNLIKSLRTIDDEIKFVVNQRLIDEKGIAISYSDKGQAGVNVDVSTKSDIKTHSGTVGLGSPTYRFGQPVKVILNDSDLNLDHDTIEVFNVIDDPASPNVDTVGDTSGGILLEVLIKDVRYKRCTIDGIAQGGLAATGFALVETGPSTGIFEGSFKMPSRICDKTGTKLISTAGGTIDLKYHDFRDSSGESNVFSTGRPNQLSQQSQPPTLNAQQFVLPNHPETIQVSLTGKIEKYIQGVPVDVDLVGPDEGSKTLTVYPTSQGNYKILITLSSESLPGTYSIYIKSQNQLVGMTSFDVLRHSIPQWIKNNAAWWSEDKISEQDFVKGIEHLIKEDIVKIPDSASKESQIGSVPEWIKTTSGWWSKDMISDDEFVLAIEYLVKKGIIRV